MAARVKKDLTGLVFGDITILGFSHKESNTRYYWTGQCNICGDIHPYLYSNLPRRTGPCRSCGKIHNIKGQKFGLLEVVEFSHMDNNRKAVWICKCECGNTKALRTNDLVSHRVHSCGCLAESLGELKIAEILQQQGMEYVKQYVFDDCKNSRGLRFDFAVIENDKVKYLIEYDGQQHFAPMGYWGGKERLVSLQTNDKIKNEYCEKNNIPLIRIPYTVKPHLITLEMLVV